MLVGPKHRLVLLLSAPISTCAAGSRAGTAGADAVLRAGVPFHVLSELCRESHPTILLSEESETASASELERSYHEVAHCAASDYGLTEGWVPDAIESADPCPLSLGSDWHLPSSAQLSAIGLDDRKALAGALFDAADRSDFSGLLLYSRGEGGKLELSNLSPNAGEAPPSLKDEQRSRPLFGVALRCVRENASSPALPSSSQALACLRAQRELQKPIETPTSGVPRELKDLRGWVDSAARSPKQLRDPLRLAELSHLLTSPTLDRLARDAAEERALTERYSELAESLDDAAASPSERARRRAEFDNLRRRLGTRIALSANGGDQLQLGALLTQVQALLEAAAAQSTKRRGREIPGYGPLLARVRGLAGVAGAH